MMAQPSCETVARVISTALLTTFITAGISQTVEAHEIEDYADRDKFKLSLGAFFVQRTSSTLRLDTTVGNAVNIGTSLDWDRDLSGDTRVNVPRIDGYYRFTPKSRVDFTWFDISLNGGILLAKDIDFGDIHFPAGEGIRSDFDISTFKASYTYTFYRAPEIEVALSAGLHISRNSMKIQNTITRTSESASVTAPLPVFGFLLDYNINPKWQVASRSELFFLDNFDKYTGSLSYFSLALEHHTFEHVKFGLGFNRIETNLSAEASDFNGQVRFVLNGYMFYTALTY